MSAWDDPITHIRELEARLSRVKALADRFEYLSKDADPLRVLTDWSVPTADHEGFLDGIKTAARDIRRALEDRP